MSNLRFTAKLYHTVRPATFVGHDEATHLDPSIPVGTAIAIDKAGDVFICRDEHRGIFAYDPDPKQGIKRTLFRDYFRYGNININKLSDAGPLFHAALNAIDYHDAC